MATSRTPGISKVNLVGFSLGGAVALEMAAAQPQNVPRLALINSLATYRPHTLRKWLETYLAASLVQLIGMPRAAYLMATRLFPQSWQRALREHAAKALAAIPATNYLGMGFALAHWAILDRLHLVRSKVLVVAAENDFTPLQEKIELARQLHGNIVVVRGSRHGTPFDSIQITNACLRAFLRDAALPKEPLWLCDSEMHVKNLTLAGSIAEEHAMSPLLID
jgi:pimeloyl-ACP methyl ester carboxylesterase